MHEYWQGVTGMENLEDTSEPRGTTLDQNILTNIWISPL